MVNNKQGLGCMPPSPSCPRTGLKLFLLQLYISCLTQILWHLWKTGVGDQEGESRGKKETEVGCSQTQALLKQSHSASALDDHIRNAKPLPARA